VPVLMQENVSVVVGNVEQALPTTSWRTLYGRKISGDTNGQTHIASVQRVTTRARGKQNHHEDELLHEIHPAKSNEHDHKRKTWPKRTEC